MARKARPASQIGVPAGDAAQMEQIRQSLAAVANDAAQKAARLTIEDVFGRLEVDITKPEGIVRLRRTLAFAGDMLDARDTIRKQSLRTAVVLLVTGFGTIVVLGLKDYFRVPVILVGVTAMLSLAHASPVF